MDDNQPVFIIADDHPLFRAAILQSLSEQFPNARTVEADDIESLYEMSLKHPDADLILLDLHMPGAHGFSGLIYLNGHFPQVPVLMVSANDSPSVIRRAADYGAAGFLSKTSSLDVIAEAINVILKGELWFPADLSDSSSEYSEEGVIAEALASLTPQQFRVVTMLAQGLLNKQIAYELGVTEATVKAHLTEIYRRLHVSSRTKAVLALSKLDVDSPQQLIQ